MYYNPLWDFTGVKQIYEKVSIQRCEGASAQQNFDRLGSKALYAFVYPNFMINRYASSQQNSRLLK